MDIPIPPKRQAVEAGVVPAWSCEAILPSRGLRAIGIAPGFGISPHLRHKPWQVDNTRAKSTTNIVQIANSVWSPCRSRSSKFNHSCTSDANLYKHRIRCTLARVNAKSTFELDNDLSAFHCLQILVVHIACFYFCSTSFCHWLPLRFGLFSHYKQTWEYQ